MKVFFQIAYFVIGVVQFFAVWDGVSHVIGAESFIGRFFAFAGAAFVTYIPLVGSAIGVYGAVNVWDWSFGKSMTLFFWYVPVYLLFLLYSLVLSRREG
ncbi:hypothetical protein VH567_07775 [Sphingomonas sp. 4RDLI-65]|uniref:hypothetical protein n=1 Tax=Sphingomonas sp. 4RDLI-65 TaxID=3111641 RepID=UPI003C2520D7